MAKRIDDVRRFWETNPLWVGESKFEPGTKAFFEEHRQTVIDDVFAGKIDRGQLPTPTAGRVLDLGCGPGYWLVEYASRGCKDISGADLAQNALALARRRAEIYNATIKLSQQNAEQLAFGDGTFEYVSCLGVMHHTPSTESCIAEIARILNANGEAVLSVYYRNIFLRSWPLLSLFGRVLAQMGAKLPGRGRENIYATGDANEIVRLYDGADNPIGKAYSREQFFRMLEPYFEIESWFLYFFPARSLPFRLPRFVHQWLDKHVGFMICVTVKPRNAQRK